MPEGPLAFIGLGLMGRPMALHLVNRGFALRVFNRNAKKTEGFSEKGAAVCRSPAEAARGARIVFTCVGDGPDVREVILGAQGIAAGASPGTLVVDHSTIAPQAVRALELECRTKGLRFLDAPITGGQKGALDGALVVMCGGAEKDFEEARPAMAAYAKKTALVGGPGMGQVAKACNQILCVHNMLGISEALSLAKALGADPEKVFDVVKDGSAGSWMLSVHGQKALKGDDAPGFYIRHQQKDLRIVLEAARESKTPLPGTALIHQLYGIVQARGGDECGNQSLFRALEVLKGSDWSASE